MSTSSHHRYAANAITANPSKRRKKPAFQFVNNRLEGNTPGTIEAVVALLA